MNDFLSVIASIGNTKTKLICWILENLGCENQLTYTYRDIAEATGISTDTVTRTMKNLLESDFLRRKNQGCYVVNPDFYFDGSPRERREALAKYQSIQKPTKEEAV